MNKTIDNETLLLKVESHDHRIEVLENLLNVAKDGYLKEQSLQDDPQARTSLLSS